MTCTVCSGPGPLYRSAGGADLCGGCVGRLAPSTVPARQGPGLLTRGVRAWADLPAGQREMAGALLRAIPGFVGQLVQEESCPAEVWDGGPVRCQLAPGHRGEHTGQTIRGAETRWMAS